MIGAGATFALTSVLREGRVTPTCDDLFTTVDELRAFLEAGSASSPDPISLVGIPEADRDQAMADYVDASGDHLQQVLTQYGTHFSARVQFLVDQLAGADLWTDPTDVVVVNELQIEHLATELEVRGIEAGCSR